MLLLSDLLKKTRQNHPDYENISKALAKVKEIIDIVNESIGLAEKSYQFWQESAISSLMAPHRICRFVEIITVTHTMSRKKGKLALLSVMNAACVREQKSAVHCTRYDPTYLI